MLCQFERLIYPQNLGLIAPGSYMVAAYRPCEKIIDSSGVLVTQIKAVGYCLPVAGNLRYDMQGHWSKNAKHGIQFEVENYDEVIIPTREGIIAYLSSGQIKGVGPKIAERIYETFGEDTLEMLDNEPDSLLTVSGISEAKLKKIKESYLANRGARDVVAFLAPHGISPTKAVKFYQEYQNKTMEIVKEHPYKLCEISGIGFLTADKIAMSMGFHKLSVERVDEGILYTLTDAESKGHLCMEKHAFIKACLKILDTPELTEDMVANRAQRMIVDRRLVSYKGNVFKPKAAYAESHLTELIERQCLLSDSLEYCDLDSQIEDEEARLKIKMADEQKEAVKMALTNGISIITGGPGTGKTLIQRAILDIYRKNYPDNEICCCAPTGRAARRMEQSTGYPSSTVHKALGLIAEEDNMCKLGEQLEADLILIDEVSMLDVYLAGFLFESIKSGAQIVLIGDADQLPSVGPGAVLSEMIASGQVPVVRLDKVFRQNAGSRIATNAKLIRHGNLALEYGDDFKFIDSPDISESANKLVELYLQETEKYGVDNVALLSPYRQKTETGVNVLNNLIRDKINPPSSSKPEVLEGRKLFRLGDKVMQVKNNEDVNNGDIGYIKKILKVGNESIIFIDFGDGRIKEYDTGDLDMIDLGYASTIHKSQGSEYISVIINLQKAHSIMLTRPLIYTAITRGKERVAIVGERRALCVSIKRTDTERRGTCLSLRLQEDKN